MLQKSKNMKVIQECFIVRHEQPGDLKADSSSSQLEAFVVPELPNICVKWAIHVFPAYVKMHLFMDTKWTRVTSLQIH